MDEQGKLAGDYREDLRKVGEPEHGVLVVKDAEAFINDYLQPSLTEKDEVHGEQLGKAYGESVARAIEADVEAQLTNKDSFEDLVQESLDDDFWWVVDARAWFPVNVKTGAIQRVRVLPTGEKMVDCSIGWTHVCQDGSQRQRPDDPFEVVETFWGGVVRFMMDDSRAYSVKLLETRVISADELERYSSTARDYEERRAVGT